VVLPLSLVVIDYLYDKNAFDLFRSARGKWAFLVVSLLYGMVIMYAEGGNKYYYNYSLPTRFCFVAYSYFYYIFKIIFPVSINHYNPLPVGSGGSAPVEYWIYPLCLLWVVYFAYRAWKRKHVPVFFACCFYTINIILCIHIIPLPRETIVANRYSYISIIGVLVLVYFAVQYLYNKYLQHTKSVYLVLLLLFVLVYLGVYANKMTFIWRSS
jgi:hypothetical protein